MLKRPQKNSKGSQCSAIICKFFCDFRRIIAGSNGNDTIIIFTNRNWVKKMVSYQSSLSFLKSSSSDDSTLEALDFIFSTSNEGLAIVDAKTTLLVHNTAFAAIFQQDGALIGRCIHDIIPQYVIGYNTQPLVINYANKKITLKEKILSSGHSGYRILIVTEHTAYGALIEEYNSIKFHKEMYEEIINSIGEGIHAIDSSGRLLIYNRSMEKLEGCTGAEVLGKHVTEVYNLDVSTSLLLKVLQEGTPILNHHQHYTVYNGQHVDVLTSTVPVYSKDEIIGSVAIVQDYTVFKNMAEKIIDLQEELHAKKSANSLTEETQSLKKNSIMGNNTRFMESVKLATIAANSVSSALIFGETGTGKELFAQLIHNEGNRATKPFLALNCAAIPESLLESMLFGTIKGAFTGALDRAGLLEQADGGTLYLDELNSMPLTLQAKLLRVLEDKKVRRLGGKSEMTVDTRIVGSLNVYPEIAIAKEQIRSDLYYRLAVIYISIPPLRERMDDLELLANYFIQHYNKLLYKNIKGLRPEVLEGFLKYYWPGNIRQLKHTLEYAMNIVTPYEEWINPQHIPNNLGLLGTFEQRPLPDPFPSATPKIFEEIKAQEIATIIAALKKHRGNITKAAAELGLSRQRLQYSIKKYKI
jgi:arginine utilization regulatory protein